MTFVYGFLLLNILIVVHEIGHLLVARMMGVKVEAFSIGFGKKIFGWKIGGIDYIVSLIPLGGYVRMKGNWDDDDEVENPQTALEKDSYDAKTPLQKIAILLGGPLSNFLFTFGILACIACKPCEVTLPIVGDINIGASTKEKEGFVSGDKILKVNGYEVSTWNDFVGILNQLEPEEFVFEVKRGEKVLEFSVDQFEILPANVTEKIWPPLWDSLKSESEFLFELTQRILDDYKDIFLPFLKDNNSESKNTKEEAELSGVIGISQGLGDVAEEKSGEAFWFYLALYSFSLGMFNLLPIVPLDGGKIILESYVLISRKPLNKKVENIFFGIGILIVLGILIFGTYNDIVRLFS